MFILLNAVIIVSFECDHYNILGDEGGGLFPSLSLSYRSCRMSSWVGLVSRVQPCVFAGGSISNVQPCVFAGGSISHVQPCVFADGSVSHVQPCVFAGGSVSRVQPCLRRWVWWDSRDQA